MAFTTLMLFQLFNVFNCRSTWRSAFDGFFENKWLIAAVALSLFTQVLVIYVPFLQAAFHTIALSAFDWMIATAVASTLLIGHGAGEIGAAQETARRLMREADDTVIARSARKSPKPKEEKMPVVAMTREMGSGGREVAQRVAERLGLTVVLHHHGRA